MIQAFRKIFQSKIGLAFTFAFIGIIALAFASADLTGVGFGGVAGGDRAATVGSQRISTAVLRTTTQNAYDQVRQQDPSLTMEEFLSEDGMDQVLDQLTARFAIFDMAQQMGIRVSNAIVGSEIAQIPAFQGADGRFNEDVFRQALNQNGLTEKLLRQDIEQSMAERMLIQPAVLGAQMPRAVTARYATLLNERRKGAIALLPSAAFAPDGAVTDATLQKYLSTNRDRYALPERRTVRYATFGPEAVADVNATDAEIAAQYEQDADTYAGREVRRLTQLVLPTEAAARAVATEIDGGASLAQAAQGKGLSTTQVTANGRASFETASSRAVAAAVYGGDNGDLVGPVRGPLGWYLLRIDNVTRTQDRTLASVRDEIAIELTATKRRRALADLASEAEEQLNGGAALPEVAEALGITVSTTGPVLESGERFGDGAELSDLVKSVVPTVFAMDEDSDAQIAIGPQGTQYILFAPGRVTPSAPPPFAEIKAQLRTDFQREKGLAAAKAASDKVLKAVAGGQTLAEAMAALKQDVPPVDSIDLSRRELVSGGQVPDPLALMFTMATDSVKRIPAPQDLGWFIIALDEIETTDLAEDDPLLEQAQAELGRLRSREYAQVLQRAIAAEVGSTRNENAITAVRSQLTGNR